MQLDLGDMLAALEKQQQAMKARQITNTRPLAHPGEALVCLHSVLQPLGYSYILSPYSVLDPLPLKRECGCPCHVEHVDVWEQLPGVWLLPPWVLRISWTQVIRPVAQTLSYWALFPWPHPHWVCLFILFCFSSSRVKVKEKSTG